MIGQLLMSKTQSRKVVDTTPLPTGVYLSSFAVKGSHESLRKTIFSTFENASYLVYQHTLMIYPIGGEDATEY